MPHTTSYGSPSNPSASPIVLGFVSMAIETEAMIEFSDVDFPDELLSRINRCIFSANGDIRFRYDGGAPTMDVGHFLPETRPFAILVGLENVKNLKLIRANPGVGLPIVFSATLEQN